MRIGYCGYVAAAIKSGAAVAVAAKAELKTRAWAAAWHLTPF